MKFFDTISETNFKQLDEKSQNELLYKYILKHKNYTKYSDGEYTQIGIPISNIFNNSNTYLIQATYFPKESNGKYTIEIKGGIGERYTDINTEKGLEILRRI